MRPTGNPPRRSRGFDAVVGNPPFLNAIEETRHPAVRALQRRAFPDTAGTADAAYLFLALASSLRGPRGRVGMIQPRAVLSAPSMRRWRAAHTRGDVAFLYAPDDARLFAGAMVHVAIVGIGASETCALGRGSDLTRVRWRREAIACDNWWQCLHAVGAPPATHAATLGERFSVRASMTAGDAYALVAMLEDSAQGDAPKLVTTGLIDRDRCAWGVAPCRYLKRVYQHPRVRDVADATPSIRRRLLDARRPKLLVAGLGARVECVLDASGEYVGAVSTFTITHPGDDVSELRGLMAYLHGDAVSRALRAQLGAAALSGGNITLTRSWLSALALDARATSSHPPPSP